MLSQRFERQPVRELAFAAEKIFRGYINADVNVANLPPNAPPPVGRFQMSDGKRTLTVSEIATQLTLDFGGSAPANHTWGSVLAKPASLMDQFGAMVTNTKGFVSATLQITRPYVGDQSAVSEVIASLFNNRFEGDAIASAYTYATRKDDVVLNVEISQYKFYEFTAQVTDPNAFVGFDMDFAEPSAEGLQIKVEVNNKIPLRMFDTMSMAQMVSHLDAASRNPVANAMIEATA